ncbi:MAG TPA: Panacea domain-containing protein [Terriglobales bacterium]|nr:Panacea domain-containing protein [Terriglobales bacterium]
MSDIKFEFNLDKLIHAIAFFSSKDVPHLTKLKIAKLLYFADKRHLLEHGRPILGDVYWCMEFGPVPSFALNEMSEAIEHSEVVAGSGSSDYSKMNEMLRVKKPLFGGYPHFEAKHPFDANIFSDSELSVLTAVAREFGSKTAHDLVTMTHAEPTYRIANESREPKGRAPIPYELFFVGAPSASMKYLAKLKADFDGEIIPLEGDEEYSQFASDLRSYSFGPEFDLDPDHVRERTARSVR